MVCVVTGAGGGVGGALVNALQSSNATTVAVHRGRFSSIMETRPKLFTVKCDLTDDVSVQTLVQNITESIGPIHVWINTAGGFHMGETVEEAPLDSWRKMLSINFITTLNCSRAVLPVMKKNKYGRIINFGSFPGEEGMSQGAPYAVSKAAVHTLTKTIWQEGKTFGVSAHALLPTTIDTPGNREAMPNEDWSNWVTTKDIADKIIEIITSPGIDRDPGQIIIPLRGSTQQSASAKPAALLDIFGSSAKSETPEPSAETVREKSSQIPVVPADEVKKQSIDLDTSDWQPVNSKGDSDTFEQDTPGAKEVTTANLIDKVPSETPDLAEDDTKLEVDLEEWEPKESSEETSQAHEDVAQEEGSTGKSLQDIFRKTDVAVDAEGSKINPDMASFEMVEHLKIRQQYDKALAMLAIMEENGADIDRIKDERDEIQELIYPSKDEDTSGENETEEENDQDTAKKEESTGESEEEEDLDLAGYLDRIAEENKKEKKEADSPVDKKKD